MYNLERSISTGSWTSFIWFGRHWDGVGLNGRPLAETEDCETEQLGGSGSDGHYSKVMG